MAFISFISRKRLPPLETLAALWRGDPWVSIPITPSVTLLSSRMSTLSVGRQKGESFPPQREAAMGTQI